MGNEERKTGYPQSWQMVAEQLVDAIQKRNTPLIKFSNKDRTPLLYLCFEAKTDDGKLLHFFLSERVQEDKRQDELNSLHGYQPLLAGNLYLDDSEKSFLLVGAIAQKDGTIRFPHIFYRHSGERSSIEDGHYTFSEFSFTPDRETLQRLDAWPSLKHLPPAINFPNTVTEICQILLQLLQRQAIKDYQLNPQDVEDLKQAFFCSKQGK